MQNDGKHKDDEIGRCRFPHEQSVFFIPIVTPRAVKSPYCKFELDSFLAREAALDRNDLVFPILYINVPALLDDALWRDDPVLSIIAKRQYLDWRAFRHHDIESTDVAKAIERFCAHITEALQRPWVTLEERKRRDAEAEELASRGTNFLDGADGLPTAEAARLFKLAAALGNAVTQTLLGNMYSQGYGGLPKDDIEAVRLYKLAADQGNAWGQYFLGNMYADGRGGLPKNATEAARLYKLAADQGNDPAKQALARLGGGSSGLSGLLSRWLSR